jgi:hypothetical protein
MSKVETAYAIVSNEGIFDPKLRNGSEQCQLIDIEIFE